MSDPGWEKRQAGRSGLAVTPLGLGGAHLGRLPGSRLWDRASMDDDVAAATVHRAFELGINLLDTSPMYGESQRRVGRALEQWFAAGGRREQFILCTKTGRGPEGQGDYSAAATRRSVLESLRLLNTDYLDLVHVHDPGTLDDIFAPGGSLEELERLKAEGLIRAIGLGARPHDQHRACIESGRVDVVLTFLDYNLLDQSAAQGVLAPAARYGVGVFNAAAVWLGLLGGEEPERVVAVSGRIGSPEVVGRAQELWLWAQQRGIDLLALNLQLCMRERRIASTLLGCGTPEEIERDVAAARTPVPESAWAELSERFGVNVPDVGGAAQ